VTNKKHVFESTVLIANKLIAGSPLDFCVSQKSYLKETHFFEDNVIYYFMILK